MFLINLLFLCLLFGRHIKAKITNNPKDREAALKAQKEMLFAPFLGMAFRCFIPMAIASYLNIQFQFSDPYGFTGEKISDYYALLISFFVCVFFPTCMLYVALVPKKWLQSPDFKDKWGFLYVAIKTENFMQRAYYFMFIMRRAVLIYSGLAMYHYPTL